VSNEVHRSCGNRSISSVPVRHLDLELYLPDASLQVMMINPMRSRPSFLIFTLLILLTGFGLTARAANDPEIFPLSQVRPGMQGVAYTIFSGDQVQEMKVSVLGVLKNAMGPKEDIILVELSGADVAKTGVVAGMSGSPVYFDGKLAGAISLKIGQFTKDAIAGVTPIQNMLDIQKAMITPRGNRGIVAGGSEAAAGAQTIEMPQKIALGGDKFLVPIETPLIFSGALPQTLAQFSSELKSYGLSVTAGGTVPASPDDANLKPGDMVGMEMISGDMSVASGCTVTAIIHGRVFVCGHPMMGLGNVAMPMTRAHVVMTLASSLESTKIMNTGGTIGTFEQDRLTGVIGQLGAGPTMLPVTVNVKTPEQEEHFHFKVVQNPKLTPLLVAIAAYNGLITNTAYTQGSTLQMDGQINVSGHPSVDLRGMFIPSPLAADGLKAALDVENSFERIYTNPYEQPTVQSVTLNFTAMPESRWASVDAAWADRSEVQPGQKVNIKVLMRPYRGKPFIQEIPVTIPSQAPRGSLQILVSDAASLNRSGGVFAGENDDKLQGLDQLIRMMNHERQNDRLYVTLLENAPTLLVEDKELPNVPASEVNVLNHQRAPGGPQLLYQSVIGQHSIPLNQVVTGQQYVSVTVK